MIEKKLLKWLLIGVVVLFIVVPYLVYAYAYQGEYKVEVSLDIESPDYAEVTVTDIQATSEAMEALDFIDVLKGSKVEVRGTFQVYVELNHSGGVETRIQGVTLMPDDAETGPVEMTFQFLEIEPGDATVRVYVVHDLTSTTVYDYTKAVTIGP
jgi:hypothetical protein